VGKEGEGLRPTSCRLSRLGYPVQLTAQCINPFQLLRHVKTWEPVSSVVFFFKAAASLGW
jgi:hypothetical protein